VVVLAQAQVPFALDTTFRLNAERRYVSSILPLPDGKVIVSGNMRFPGELYDMLLVRLLPDGTRDETFNNSGMGGGKLTPWQDRFYAGRTLGVERILESGQGDPSFAMPGGIPYFNPLQGGAYHVFPDGRVVMSGAHMLSDTVRGFTGLHQFIWFTNTGYLDTTRIHRKASGNLYRFIELPDGKFIISGQASVYDGRPVSRIFRMHTDGGLDTTFNTGMNWGEAKAFLPLPNGKVIAGGFMRFQGSSDTLRLVRFMPDGNLDPTFNSPQFGLGALPNVGVSALVVRGISPWEGGRLVVTGKFQTVDGHVRRGICMLDSTGALLQAFNDQGVWPYVQQSITSAALEGMVPYDLDRYLVWGQYHGYSDGETEDMQQRFITRLIAGDVNTDPVSTTGFSVEQGRVGWFHLYPNPARDNATIAYTFPAQTGQAQVRLLDLAGRELEAYTLRGNEGRLLLDTHAFAPGLYLVELRTAGSLVEVRKLVVE